MRIFDSIRINYNIAVLALMKQAKLGAASVVAQWIPLHLIERMAGVVCLLATRCSNEHRHAFAQRVETVQAILARPDVDAPRIRMTGILEKLLDIKVYFADSVYSEWESIDRIAIQLQKRIAEMQARYPDQPIVLSPFHYASQYVNMLVCEQLRIRLGIDSLSVVTAVEDDVYGADVERIPHIKRLRSYLDGRQASLGVVREMKRRGFVILFADVPPSTLSTTPMETVTVELFGKQGRIHNGVFRLGGKMRALLLPYYIKLSEGQFQLTMFDAIELEQKQAPQRLAVNIAQAFIDNHAQWLPSNHPSFYYFSSSK